MRACIAGSEFTSLQFSVLIKKVARTRFVFNTSRIFAVFTLSGPSSKVSATTFFAKYEGWWVKSISGYDAVAAEDVRNQSSLPCPSMPPHEVITSAARESGTMVFLFIAPHLVIGERHNSRPS